LLKKVSEERGKKKQRNNVVWGVFYHRDGAPALNLEGKKGEHKGFLGKPNRQGKK